jgi:hypothetical protein
MSLLSSIIQGGFQTKMLSHFWMAVGKFLTDAMMVYHSEVALRYLGMSLTPANWG